MTLDLVLEYVRLAIELLVTEVVATVVLGAVIVLEQLNIFARSPALRLGHPDRQCEQKQTCEYSQEAYSSAQTARCKTVGPFCHRINESAKRS